MTQWFLALAASVTGIVLTGIQIVERISIAQDPAASLMCDVNSVLACSTVLGSWQSSVIAGIPNAFIGAVLFSIVASASFAALLGSTLTRGFVTVLWAVIVVFALFDTWFMVQTAFVIQALCLWCIGIGTAIAILGAVFTRAAASSGYLGAAMKEAARTGLDLFAWLGWWVIIAGLLVVGLAS